MRLSEFDGGGWSLEQTALCTQWAQRLTPPDPEVKPATCTDRAGPFGVCRPARCPVLPGIGDQARYIVITWKYYALPTPLNAGLPPFAIPIDPQPPLKIITHYGVRRVKVATLDRRVAVLHNPIPRTEYGELVQDDTGYPVQSTRALNWVLDSKTGTWN